MLQLRLVLLLMLLAWPAAAATLTPDQAAAHVGQTATVCGTVVDARFANSTKGKPTFLNFGAAYPNQIFTVLIWGTDRAKFGAAESRLRGKQVCVFGVIQLYRGKPEIIVTDPQQLVEQTPRS